MLQDRSLLHESSRLPAQMLFAAFETISTEVLVCSSGLSLFINLSGFVPLASCMLAVMNVGLET